MESISPKINIPRAPEFAGLLRERLPDKTYRHSLSVAEYMVDTAPKAEITIAQAATAGLLHDLCKAMKPEALLEAAGAYGLTLTEGQRAHPGLLHGPIAAEEARRRLGITDEDVYEAIYWHTTGLPHWSRVGLALYVADFAEPLRPRPEAAKARTIIEQQGFIPALKYVVRTKTAYIEKRLSVDPVTKAFAEWVLVEFGQ